MPAHNILAELHGMLADALVKTATYTITLRDLMEYGSFVANHASTTVAFTLPAATAGMDGCVALFANKAAANATVAVTAGFGGAGSGTDTVTLAQGDSCLVWCDGSYWYALHHTTGG